MSQPFHFACFVRDLASTRRFYGEPRTRYAGQAGEQATMFLLDPSGNALEFKSFKHAEHVFSA